MYRVVGQILVGMDISQMEIERSKSLLRFMENEGLLPSLDKEIKRKNAIDKLKQIVMEWAQKIAHQRQFPESCIRAASAKILIYGSCGLGVHNNETDIDALCVGSCLATMAEDFFVVLRDMLTRRPEVSKILCIKDARVPLMRLNFDGISVDLSYAKLDTIFVPSNVLDPFFLANIDDISWRSLSDVCVNKSILALVPNIEIYQSLLRGIKFWARRRGIYASVLGFFGGIHLAVLAAFVCQKQPNSRLSALVSIFFETFAFWPWPKPVILEDGVMPLQPNNSLFGGYTMPIQVPCNRYEYCCCGITRSTFNRINKEFQHGYALTKDLLLPHFDWKLLFEPFSYAKNYETFLKIYLSSTYWNELEEWVNRVKSRFRHLLFKLEELLEFCGPNPTQYVDSQSPEPHVVFYWGLRLKRSINISVDSIKEDFTKNILMGYEGTIGRMELKVVRASEFPKTTTNA